MIFDIFLPNLIKKYDAISFVKNKKGGILPETLNERREVLK